MTVKSFVTLCLLLLFGSAGTAQAVYPFSAIPAELLPGADMVVREYDLKFEVLSEGEALETEHKVITLLNDAAAKREGDQAFYYSKFTKIEDIEAAVYDAAGQLVRRMKKKDIEDIKVPEYFVNDTRYKVLRLPARAYPYTIEYTVVSRHTGLMFYPAFSPQQYPSAAVQHAHFQVNMPTGLEVRTKTDNLPQGALKGKNKWEFKNIKPYKTDVFAPIGYNSAPRILTAPTSFQFGGYSGNMASWESYGAFMQNINKTQRELPEATKAKLQTMVANCPDRECKVRRVYEYLQNNTRYFFIGLGIGGWQPAAATDVDRFKYGDCKGLSNYTVAMLEAVGVPAFYTIIRAGEKEQANQFPDFPNAWFNHIIVCVPNGRDSIWLECTSQTESFGFLGDFTDNRPALLVTPEGGKLVQTPVYNESTNITRRTTTVAINPDGSATLQSDENYSGLAQEIPAALEGFHDEVRKEYLYKLLNINNFEIDSLTITRQKTRIPSAGMRLSLHLPKIASVSGKRMFLPANLLALKNSIPALDSTRMAPVQAHSRGKTEEDNLILALPEGYRLEGNPEPVHVENAFGSFDMRVTGSMGNVTIHRKLVLNSSIQPKEKMGELVNLLKTIAKADSGKLVVVKQT